MAWEEVTLNQCLSFLLEQVKLEEGAVGPWA